MPRRPWSAGTRLFSSADYSSDSSTDDSSGGRRCWATLAPTSSGRALAGDAGGVYSSVGAGGDGGVPAGALALPALAAALRASRARTFAAQAKASRLQESAGQLRDALRAARKGAEKADRTARELSQSELRVLELEGDTLRLRRDLKAATVGAQQTEIKSRQSLSALRLALRELEERQRARCQRWRATTKCFRALLESLCRHIQRGQHSAPSFTAFQLIDQLFECLARQDAEAKLPPRRYSYPGGAPSSRSSPSPSPPTPGAGAGAGAEVSRVGNDGGDGNRETRLGGKGEGEGAGLGRGARGRAKAGEGAGAGARGVVPAGASGIGSGVGSGGDCGGSGSRGTRGEGRWHRRGRRRDEGATTAGGTVSLEHDREDDDVYKEEEQAGINKGAPSFYDFTDDAGQAGNQGAYTLLGAKDGGGGNSGIGSGGGGRGGSGGSQEAFLDLEKKGAAGVGFSTEWAYRLAMTKLTAQLKAARERLRGEREASRSAGERAEQEELRCRRLEQEVEGLTAKVAAADDHRRRLEVMLKEAKRERDEAAARNQHTTATRALTAALGDVVRQRNHGAGATVSPPLPPRPAVPPAATAAPTLTVPRAAVSETTAAADVNGRIDGGGGGRGGGRGGREARTVYSAGINGDGFGGGGGGSGGSGGRGFDSQRRDSHIPGPLSPVGAAHRPLLSAELAPTPAPAQATTAAAAATSTAGKTHSGWRDRRDPGSTPLRDRDRRVEARAGVAATRVRASGAVPVSSNSRLFSRGDDSKSRLFSRGDDMKSRLYSKGSDSKSRFFSRGDDWLSAPRTTFDLGARLGGGVSRGGVGGGGGGGSGFAQRVIEVGACPGRCSGGAAGRGGLGPRAVTKEDLRRLDDEIAKLSKTVEQAAMAQTRQTLRNVNDSIDRQKGGS